MKNTTLCYLEKDNKYLMLLRNKKKIDENKGKWIGVGGKFEEGESPEECAAREVHEETGLTMTDCRYRGLITFTSDEWGTEYLHLFTSQSFYGELTECDEGELAWIDKSELLNLRLWTGDRIFLRLLLEDAGFFSMKFCYQGDELSTIRVFGDEELRKRVREIVSEEGILAAIE